MTPAARKHNIIDLDTQRNEHGKSGDSRKAKVFNVFVEMMNYERQKKKKKDQISEIVVYSTHKSRILHYFVNRVLTTASYAPTIRSFKFTFFLFVLFFPRRLYHQPNLMLNEQTTHAYVYFYVHLNRLSKKVRRK